MANLEASSEKVRRMPSGANLISSSSTLRRSNSGAKLAAAGSGLKRSNSGASLVSGLFKSKPKQKPSPDNLEVGCFCEVVHMVVMRRDEMLESEAILELPEGSRIEVLELSKNDRIKVAARGTSGWIGLRNRLNEATIVRRSKMDAFDLDGYEVGGQHEVLSAVTARQAERLDSPAVAELFPGALVHILEICPPCRARVLTNAGPNQKVEGWITLMNKNGEPMLGKVSGKIGKRDSTVTCDSKVKTFLEAARAGDLDVLKKASSSGGFISSKKLDVNCCDVRGKTPLIYASAFGNLSIVEWLLEKPDINVNAVDDTQRSALHHTAKMAHFGSAPDIVKMLLNAGAIVNSRDHIGTTPLMFAAANGAEEMATSLLDARAIVDASDFEGCTPMEYASSMMQDHMMTLLREYGARDDDSDNDSTPSVSTAVPSVSEVMTSSLPNSGRNSEEEEKNATDSIQSLCADADSVLSQEISRCQRLSVTRTKGKAKAKASTKKRGSLKAFSKTSMAKKASITMAMESRTHDDFAAEVPFEDDCENPTMRASALLAKVVTNASGPKELETALEVAIAACVDELEISQAQVKLKELKHRVKALEKLLAATQARDVIKLQETIAKAEKYNVATIEIEKARAILEEEQPKEDARRQLHSAAEKVDVELLHSAIALGKKVGLGSDELKRFKHLLRSAKSKTDAEATLQKAVEERDVVSLRFALGQARSAGVDESILQRAQSVLDVEEPRDNARKQLFAAMEAINVDMLRGAIEIARIAKLSKDEMAGAQEMLQAEEAKAAALRSVCSSVEESKQCDATCIEDIRRAKDRITDAIKEAKVVGVLENDLVEAELRRKKLHNTIEDLKGSIRVFCRMRPLNGREKQEGAVEVIGKVDSMTVKANDGSEFSFDAVFSPGTQEEVFQDCKDLVQSAIDGYNVTIFSYGQTGAGKTYTMYGVPGQEGTAPRSIHEIYRIIAQESGRFNFTVMGSMLELYQSELVDLLSKESDGPSKKLNVKTDLVGNVVIERLVEEECKDAAALENLLERGNKQRSVAATAMNSESSRSHLLFIVKIVSVNRETNARVNGKIMLCDLAGSERLKKSEVTGEQKKESIEINKSLTALGDVIAALTKREKQIPYRNHKLTQLMQDTLGGTAKTLMFVNCSPADTNLDETLMALKYATRAKQITNVTTKK